MIFAVFDVLLAVNMCINYSFFYIYSTIKSKDTEVLGGLRARPNEIKPDPVDQSERTAHYDCAMCIAEMLHCAIAQRHFC